MQPNEQKHPNRKQTTNSCNSDGNLGDIDIGAESSIGHYIGEPPHNMNLHQRSIYEEQNVIHPSFMNTQ